MCIICAKPAGVKFPKDAYIKNMWEGNSDGAGIMWTSNNKVHIKKGFMKYKDFKNFLVRLKKRYDIDKIPVVMHFRITTHGGTKPENTHPFPISSKVKNLQALEYCTNLGVAHNGTISIKNPPEISDTMAYISQRLSRIRTRDGAFYKKQLMLDKIEKEITSKMCFLDNAGNLKFIGKFEEEDGVFYSNTSYLGYRRWYSYDYGYYGGYGGYRNSSKYNTNKSSYYEDEWDGNWDYYENLGGYRSSKTYNDVNPSSNENSLMPKTYTTYMSKELMYVDGYLYNKGELIEGTIFIDEDNKAYIYDEVEDICERQEGVAYTAQGTYAKFKEKKAVKMRTKEVHSFNPMAM